jgi:hypothetical protein
MFRYSLPLALVLASACLASPARAAQQPASTQQNRKVWTNADMDDLRARGLISIIGSETEATPPPAPESAAAPALTGGPVYASRFEDPEWYAEQAAGLQTALQARAAALAQAQTSLAEARELRGTTGSFNMASTDDSGVTPEEHIAILAAQVREAQDLFEELADLARRNNIAPGIVRSAAG